MSNSGWAVVVVVALVIVALFGYWAIEGGGDIGGNRGESARIESNVDVDRAPAERSGDTDVNIGQPPAERSGGDANVNIEQPAPERSGGSADVDVRQEEGSQTAEQPRGPAPAR